MKPQRILLFGIGLLVVLVVLLGILAMSSGVQTWAARRALASQSDVAGEIGRVQVGLQRIEAESVVLRLPDFTLTLPRLQADVAVLQAARENIRVSRVVAKGWVLDLTRPNPELKATTPPQQTASLLPAVLAQAGATGTAATPVTDIFAALELPVDLHELDGVELEGEVIYAPEPGAAPARALVRIEGGGLQPGSEGVFQLRAETRLEGPDAPVASLTADASLAATQQTPRTFAALRLQSTIDASGGMLPAPARLLLNILARNTDQQSEYQVELRTPEKPLFELRAAPVADNPQRVAGEWRLALGREDLAPFLLGLPLPQFVSRGEGKVDLQTSGAMALSGQLQTQVSELEQIEPKLGPIGALAISTDFDAQFAGDAIRVTALRGVVSGERPVAEIGALQGFEYSLSTGELRIADPEAELFMLTLAGFPLEWAAPFVAPYQITGGSIQGSWSASARDGGFVLRAAGPLKVGGVTVRDAEQILVENLNLAVLASGEYMPSGWQARIEDGHVQSGATRLADFDARAGQAAAPGASLVATSRFQLNLAPLARQPVAAPLALLRDGVLAGEFIVSLNEKTEAAVELELANAVAQTGEILPRIAVDLRADATADGRVEVYAPISITQNGRASDLTVRAQVQLAEPRPRIDAAITGQHVFVQDVQVLLAPFAGAENTESPAAEDTEGPVWNAVEGELKFNFGTVVYSEALTVTQVEGQVVIGPEALRIPNVGAILGTGGEFTFQGGLQHDAAAARPYSLQGEIKASAVDVGKLMQAVNPGSAAPVEGTFDLNSTVTGQVADLAQLGEAAALEAKLTSRGGVLRALSVKVTETARQGSTIANVAGLIGSITGDSRTQRYAERLKAATDLVGQLASLNFDQLNLDLSRTPGEGYTIRDLSLISPTIRMLGSGEISDRPQRSFWEEPLQMQLQLGARGPLAENLKILRLLSEDADTLGYLPMVEQFTLEGSLSSITTPKLQALISRALSMQ